MAELIDGNAIAAQIRLELRDRVREMQDTLGVTPGLAVILVGERRDSATYVRSKKKACAEVGIASFGFDYPADITEEELLNKIDELNNGKSPFSSSCSQIPKSFHSILKLLNPFLSPSLSLSLSRSVDDKVNGILVQLPLPGHINEGRVLNRISQEKDVDGLHPLNVAQLANTKTHAPGRSTWSFDNINFHVSCTPQGCIELLDRSGVAIEGKEAVVIGRSNIVGIPVALLLMQRNATVTIAHSRTQNIEEVVRRADIVVAAVGRAEMVKGSWIKPGAVVIDVGINSVDDPSDKRGYRLVGDANFNECRLVASKITPVSLSFYGILSLNLFIGSWWSWSNDHCNVVKKYCQWYKKKGFRECLQINFINCFIK